MYERKQRTQSSMLTQPTRYSPRIIDRWLHIGTIIGWVCGLAFFIISFMARLNVFVWLGAGALTIGVAASWSRSFRRTMRSMQQSEQQKHLPTTKTRRIFMGLGGIGLIIIGGLWLIVINKFHYWWLDLLGEWGAGLALVGLVLIVQAVKKKRIR